MPKLKGHESILKIKEKVKEGYRNCVVVGHSADDSKDIVDDFMNNGADFFEKKPISH